LRTAGSAYTLLCFPKEPIFPVKISESMFSQQHNAVFQTLERLIVVLIMSIGLVCWSGCASMGKPGGGPADEESPQILKSFPESGSLLIDSETRFEITFSESVDPGTFAEALFISPLPEEKPDISWRGKTVRIKFRDPIPENKTVVVTIGSGLSDLRKNNLTESFSFAVSTGNRLDKGRIEGRVFDSKSVQGMLVGAWSVKNDSIIDPIFGEPRYLTQVGEDGKYKLEYLPDDTYRVLCWDDKNRDHKFDPEMDRIGFPWQDITLLPDSLEFMSFQPTRIDTGKIKFLFASASDQHHASLRINRNPQWNADHLLGKVHIEDSTQSLPIMSAWYDSQDSTRIIFRTEKQIADQEYRVILTGDTMHSVFRGEARPDTIPPAITVFSPEKDGRDVAVNIDGLLAFDDELVKCDWKSILQLSIVDSISVPVSVQQIGTNVLGWHTESAVPVGVKCELKLDLTGVFDASGNPGAVVVESIKDSSTVNTDSVNVAPETDWVNYFSIIDPVKTGSISGNIRGSGSIPIIVAARPDRSNSKDKSFVRAENKGDYSIEHLKSGGYLIWAFEDGNGNGVFNPGALIPFMFSERFVLYEDTVTVRERWESGGINLNFD